MAPDNPPVTHSPNDPKRPDKPRDGPSCGVNMTFNYVSGAVASAVGLALVYVGWAYFMG
jgi:hypothetical protein